MGENRECVGVVVSQADEFHYLIEETACIVVKRPERVESRNFGQYFDVVSLFCGNGHALDFVYVVADENERICEVVEVKGAGGVGGMVRDGNEFFVSIQVAEVFGKKMLLNF